jgi:hypothetical protein
MWFEKALYDTLLLLGDDINEDPDWFPDEPSVPADRLCRLATHYLAERLGIPLSPFLWDVYRAPMLQALWRLSRSGALTILPSDGELQPCVRLGPHCPEDLWTDGSSGVPPAEHFNDFAYLLCARPSAEVPDLDAPPGSGATRWFIHLDVCVPAARLVQAAATILGTGAFIPLPLPAVLPETVRLCPLIVSWGRERFATAISLLPSHEALYVLDTLFEQRVVRTIRLCGEDTAERPVDVSATSALLWRQRVARVPVCERCGRLPFGGVGHRRLYGAWPGAATSDPHLLAAIEVARRLFPACVRR